MQKLFNDVKASIDNLYDWPEQAEKPVVQRNEDSFDALMVQLSGDSDKDTLIKVAKQVERALLAAPEIHKLQRFGADKRAIYINIEPQKLKQYQLTYQEIAVAIKAQSIRSKSGLLKTNNGQFLLYSSQHAKYKQQLQSLVIKVLDNQHIIYLADIAQINDGFIEHDSQILFNNQPSIGFAIKMSGKSDVLAISEDAQRVVAQINETLADNLKLTIWFDASSYVQQRLDLLQNSAFQGFILVFIILALFLQVKLAFWVAIGLPVAIAGTFIVLGPLGLQFTINEVTTFGFILVLGILVDDAVVVGESIYDSKQQYGDSIKSTIKGVNKVALPTIFGVLTTVVALIPMTRFPSEAGRLFAGFAWVIIIALLFSLLESKFILPAHLRHTKTNNSTSANKLRNRLRKIRELPATLLTLCKQHIYKPLLEITLNYRYAWLISFFALSIAVLGALYQGKIRSVLFPDIPSDLIIMTVELEANAPLQYTQQAEIKINQVKQAINKRYQQQGVAGDVIEKSMSVMYEQGVILIFAQPLNRAKRAGVALKQIAKEWREPIKNLVGVVSSEVMISLAGSSAGSKIVLQHHDSEILDLIVQQAKLWLKQQPVIINVKDEQGVSMPQLSFSLKPQAKMFGITAKMLADQLSLAYGGLEIDRFYRNQQQVKVYLSQAREHRDSRSDFRDMLIINNQQQSFPLLAVAEIKADNVFNSVNRYDGLISRTLNLEIDKSISSPEVIYQTLQSNFVTEKQQQYPQLILQAAGELEESQDSISGLQISFIVALLSIYLLLALSLKNYSQPIIIMSVIPFGLVGAVLGHLWLGITVSLFSWLGMLTLAGVVVNDSLLLVSSYNQYRINKLTITDAIIEACQSRFRAIFLTTVTTFAGLYPLLNASSEQAQYLIPAAASMAYGLLFGTIICLFLIPVLLLISNDIKLFLTAKQWPQRTVAKPMI